MSPVTHAVPSTKGFCKLMVCLLSLAMASPGLAQQTSLQLLGTFSGHSGIPRTVTFSPEGRMAAIGVDRYLHFIDVASGKTLRTLTGHTNWIRSAAFSPDGETLLTGSDDGTVRLWDVLTGEELRAFKGHTSKVYGVAFSGDGRKMLSGSEDKTARLWDLSTGETLQVLSGHTDVVQSVAFSRDNTTLLTGSWDRTARLWDAQSGKEKFVLAGHTGKITSVALNRAGTLAVTGSEDKTARVWEVASGKNLQVLTGHTDFVNAVDFSRDNKTVLTGSKDRTLRLWDATTGTPQQSFTGHFAPVRAAAFSRDGRSILSGSEDMTARMWDVATQQQVLITEGHTDNVIASAFSPDGKILLTGSYDRSAKLWDVATGKELKTLSGHSSYVWAVAYSPDGKSVLTGSWDRTVKLWDVATAREIRSFLGHTDFVNAVAYSPDLRTLLSGSKDKTARLWDLKTGTLLHTLSGHTDGVNVVAYSPDGKTVVTGAQDRTVRLWETSTGKALKTLQGHKAPVLALAYSPDGKTIVSGSSDKTVRVWDAVSGLELRSSPVFSPFFLLGEQNTALVHSGCQQLQQLNLQTGMAMQTFSLGENCFSQFAVGPDGRKLVTNTGQLNRGSTFSLFGLPDAQAVVLPQAQKQVAEQAPFEIVTPVADNTFRREEVFDVVLQFPSPIDPGTPVVVEMGREVLFDRPMSPVGTSTLLTLRNLQVPADLGGPQVLRVRAQGQQQQVTVQLPEKTRPNLYFLGIAVGQFEDSADIPKLSYTVSDVKAMADFYRQQAGKAWNRVDVVTLFNPQARHQEVLKQFQVLADKKPGPEDTVVLFISSHGFAVRATDGSPDSQFYAALYDSDIPSQLSDTLPLESQVQRMLPESLIAELVARLNSQVVVILDTCYSGAVTSRGSRGNSKAIGVASFVESQSQKLQEAVTRSANKVILSSTGPDSLSYEYERLGHGAFTYALLEQLKKAQQDQKPLTVSALMGQVSDQVFQLTRKEQYGPQAPEMTGSRFLFMYPELE